jgi:hypothetical protein
MPTKSLHVNMMLTRVMSRAFALMFTQFPVMGCAAHDAWEIPPLEKNATVTKAMILRRPVSIPF